MFPIHFILCATEIENHLILARIPEWVRQSPVSFLKKKELAWGHSPNWIKWPRFALRNAGGVGREPWAASAGNLCVWITTHITRGAQCHFLIAPQYFTEGKKWKINFAQRRRRESESVRELSSVALACVWCAPPVLPLLCVCERARQKQWPDLITFAYLSRADAHCGFTCLCRWSADVKVNVGRMQLSTSLYPSLDVSLPKWGEFHIRTMCGCFSLSLRVCAAYTRLSGPFNVSLALLRTSGNEKRVSGRCCGKR